MEWIFASAALFVLADLAVVLTRLILRRADPVLSTDEKDADAARRSSWRSLMRPGG